MLIAACGGGEPLIYELENQDNPSSSLKTIRVYLETSVSMKGYVNSSEAGDFKLKEVIPFLISDLDEKITDVEMFTITDEPKRYTKTKSQFFESLRDGSLLGGKSSQLHRIFKQLIDSTGKNEVSILVSDCILDIGSRYNITERGKMTYEIYNALNGKEGMAAVTFLYYSDFNGDHYYTRENAQPFAGQTMKKRPFFIWLLGDKNGIEEILEKNIVRDYEASYSYGISNVDMSPVILPYPKKGKIIINEEKGNIRVNEPPISFTIGINANKIPDFYLKQSLIEQSLTIDKPFLGASFEFKDVKMIQQVSKYEEIANLISHFHLTHFITVALKKMPEKGESFSVLLPKPSANWITMTSKNDDKDVEIESLEGKTFSFKYITDAFERKFEEEMIFEIKIKPFIKTNNQNR